MPAVANLVGSLAGVLGAEDDGVVAIVFGYPCDIEQEAEREGAGRGHGSETWSITGGRRGDAAEMVTGEEDPSVDRCCFRCVFGIGGGDRRERGKAAASSSIAHLPSRGSFSGLSLLLMGRHEGKILT